ncbi:hypothetical protein BDU57DRAFT_511351 [Ampelomyces quisqualis]|uniref:Uncharacterized protein n=1 Tax=Ampelomyces quisqualis TaxID=50730 RepID=A0A6A5QXR7_AMPQU|nr:hypothetical protein BDU57DRAFT_511351 [Ampelomyces quisqualis]
MDNWGDPWADNDKTATKDAVTAPLPSSFAPASTILGGFLDDAGWGNEDESCGDWSAAITAAKDIETVTPSTSAAPEPSSTEYTNHETDTPNDQEQVVSESSDSATTSQANAGTEPFSTTPRIEPEDHSSARPSTSPSEGSHNDAPADSPRTSYEEERGEAKTPAVAGGPLEDCISGAQLEDGDEDLVGGRNENDHAPREASPLGAKDSTDSVHDGNTAQEPGSDDAAQNTPKTPVVTPKDTSSSTGTFTIDTDLLGKLFQSPTIGKPLDDAPDDPIHSTSARKAWYRLTRKQTLREYNNGNDDDNYVRVTWPSSKIRSEVSGIVGRWVRDDRIAGTGPGARASFYWDTSAPIDPKPISDLMRKRASAQTATMITPRQESLPSLSTNVPAAFNWSSASATAEPNSSPMAPFNSTGAQIKEPETRAASLDLLHELSPPKHARHPTIAGETPAVTSLISPPIPSTDLSLADTSTALDELEINTTSTNDLLTGAVDDEDEWGEMVSSSTVSNPIITEPVSQTDTRNNTTLLTANVTPDSIKSIKVREESPDAMHAFPIVRLKSTISPTSALFKANSFVPLGAEQGPIGPGILKPAKRSVRNTRNPEDLSAAKPAREKPPLGASGLFQNVDVAVDLSAPQISVPNVLAFQRETKEKSSNVTIPFISTTRPITPTHSEAPSVPTEVDAWADADFSFFETTLPPAPQLSVEQNCSDQFTTVETRDRSSSAASSAKTFTRSPPRKVPTPPIQPLTSATSRAQRRKMEEEGIIEDILRALPDLSYMLQ